MYTSFYNLERKPFQISSDPAFIWLGEKHREALATLTYGVLDNKGFMLLTGDVGTGKTTLINTLIKGLSEDILYASVPDPRLELNDFLNYVANAFNIRKTFTSKGQFLIYFSDFLARAYTKNKKVLLLIDESQLLTQDLLEEIRLLSNIQKDGNNLLNIFFVGQDEFNEILERPENRAVAQRLTLNYHLAPLSEEETGTYIKHRLSVAGTQEQLFDRQAIREIHLYSGGFPRRINILCDHCLLTGYVRELKMVDAEIVRRCAHELKIPQYTARKTHPPRPAPPPAEGGGAQGKVKDAAPPKQTVEEAAAIPVARRMHRPAPTRPIPRRRPRRSFRPVLVAVALFAVSAALLYVFDRRMFETMYSGVEEYLITFQNMVNGTPAPTPPPALATSPAGEATPTVKSPAPSDMASEAKPVDRQPPAAAPTVHGTEQKAVRPISKESAGKGTGSAEPEVGPKVTEAAVAPQASGTQAAMKMPEEGAAPKATEETVAPKLPEPRVDPNTTEETVAPKLPEPGAAPKITDEAVAPQVSEPEAGTKTVEAAIAPKVPDQEVSPKTAETTAAKDVARGDPLPAIPPPGQTGKQEPAPPALPANTIIVHFDNDSSEFSFADRKELDDLVAAAKLHPEAVLVLSGYADSFGSEGYNYRLSLFRANVLKSYFLGKGIPSHQLKVQAFGSNKPIKSNDTLEGRRMNRRVEIDVVQ